MSDAEDNYQDSAGSRGPRGGGGRFGKFTGRPLTGVKPEEDLEYKNFKYLTKFVSQTGKLQPRRRTGFSGQDQRRLANAVKVARFMGLMPYVGSAASDSNRSGRRY